MSSDLTTLSSTPIPAKRALRKLGNDIRDARRRRRIQVATLAERASISRTTLYKVEQGDTGVSMAWRRFAKEFGISASEIDRIGK